MNLATLGASAGLHADERELIIAYIATLETGSTRDHCKCIWTEVEPGKWLKGDQHEDCPVHTREGFLLGFLLFCTMVADGGTTCKHGVTFDSTHVCGPCIVAWTKCPYDKFHMAPALLCARCGWKPELATLADAAARR